MNELGICGWLSRDGNFYECGESKHNLLAGKLERELDLKLFDEVKGIYLHDTALLETLGFIKFTQSTYGLIGEVYDNQFMLFFGDRFSLKQRKWMEMNILRMSPRQRAECRQRLIRGY
ncbi:hypothetical protein [Clostridium saccharoperbutylacetonicum]|uniref:hypothetical protein n=1 Tax=Clostridium saccharoperbutylacetonicum TaxID=36745 RepID=UPI000983925D|nr:hypothetical protein [Clostridium saccharoperbutylacetonicum]AQR95444.1 hypothetical protein CLSAP_27600 [Clostridium saccharoperbutylacetonicum]NSB31303.1 hypothetical protein [Clostridium saccharoperbutylacetonicum]